jgi:hypothetical protein
MLSRVLRKTIGSGPEPALKRDMDQRRRKLAFDPVNPGMLWGRQLVWLIINFYKTNRNLSEKYTWEDINSGTQWLGDDRLEEYMSNWYRITGNLSVVVDERSLMEVQLANFRKAKGDLSHDIKDFERFDEGHENRTLQWLCDRADALISRKRMQSAREAQKKGLAHDGGIKSGGGNAAPAPGDKGKTGGGKGGKKGKGKGRKGGSKEDKDGWKAKGGGKAQEQNVYGLCLYFARGTCTRDNCPYLHASAKQLAKALGKGKEGEEQSGGDNNN